MAPLPDAALHETATHRLWHRAALVAGVLNRAHAELVDVAAELVTGGHWGDGGFRSPEHWLVVRAGLSPARAADIVRLARRQDELPDTRAALSAGELSIDQAAVLARHARADYQASLARFARHTTVPQLRRALSRSVFLDPAASPDVSADDAPADDAPADHASADGAPADATAPPEPVRSWAETQARRDEEKAAAKAGLSMHYDARGRFQLRYSAPAEVGALVEQALKEAKDALFIASEGSDAGHLPSYGDALAELASRSMGSVSSGGRAAHYRVYVHLSTDGAWVGGGGAITPRMASRFACDGTVQPLWETDGRPVSVGRSQRIVPARTRRLIEDRDRGCRFPGCTATRFTEVHHLDHWAEGGATDYDRQVSLCPAHHDAHHRGDVTVSGDPVLLDGLTFTNRYGVRVRPPGVDELRAVPVPPAGPPTGPTTGPAPYPRPYPSPSGGPMWARDVEFVPDQHAGLVRASSP